MTLTFEHNEMYSFLKITKGLFTTYSPSDFLYGTVSAVGHTMKSKTELGLRLIFLASEVGLVTFNWLSGIYSLFVSYQASHQGMIWRYLRIIRH